MNSNIIANRIKDILQWAPGKKQGRLILGIACLWGFVRLINTAWIGDDAYITFRVVDNFIHGYGLRWNVYERVQAYTNPLWMLLHIVFFRCWSDIYHLTFVLSFCCTVASVAIVARTFPKSPAIIALYLIVPLFFARSWVEYAMSGLENPLSYLLFAWFGWLLLHAKKTYQWFWLSLVAALAMLNRLDTGLVYFPPLIWLAVKQYPEVKWRQLALGFLLLIGWFSFSLFYYGFLFPNTKYAKLNTGLSILDYWQQGIYYTADLLGAHAPTAVILLVALVIGSVCCWRFFHTHESDAQRYGMLFSIALGILAYWLYIINVGGDFMSGRFFALPVFIAIWLIYAVIPQNFPLIFGVAVILYLSVLDYESTAINALEHQECQLCFWQGIADERWWYTDNTLVRRWPFAFRTIPEFPWVKDGLKWHSHPPSDPLILPSIGMIGYYGGSNLWLINQYGLSDPLLARLPIEDLSSWRIGHFERTIPEGYIYAVKTGSTQRMNPHLAQYYEKLRLITSGDLWDWERVKTIVAFNLGYYDKWKDAYLK